MCLTNSVGIFEALTEYFLLIFSFLSAKMKLLLLTLLIFTEEEFIDCVEEYLSENLDCSEYQSGFII